MDYLENKWAYDMGNTLSEYCTTKWHDMEWRVIEDAIKALGTEIEGVTSDAMINLSDELLVW